MDLSNLQTAKHADAGADLVLVHPITGEALTDDAKKAPTITIKGTDSETFRKLKFDKMKKIRALGDKVEDADFETIDKDAIDEIIAMTVGFKNIELDGEQIKFTKESAHELYTSCPWVVDQIRAFIVDRSNFIKG